MAYDENLAARVRETLANETNIIEKKMFGGTGYLLNGNMACGVHKDSLVVRVGAPQYESALEKPYASPFDITGRAMKGWVLVAPTGVADDANLAQWVRWGVEFARTLPPK